MKGIGMKKHGVSGHSGKSPKFRHAMKREAEKREKKAPAPLPYRTASEAINSRKIMRKSS